jgi:hypothetical protein
MPFVLLSALILNSLVQANGLSATPFRLLLLSAAFPIGFSIGRSIYLRWAHIKIEFDSMGFIVMKGSKEIANGSWRSYKDVSIIIDRYGRPNLRLYKSLDGEYSDLPISKTSAKPQAFRDFVKDLVSTHELRKTSPQVAEAA